MMHDIWEYDPELWMWLLGCLEEAAADLVVTMTMIIAVMWLAVLLLPA